MNIEVFVDSLLPNGWQDTDSRDVVLTEITALKAELKDDELAQEIVRNLFEAFQTEYNVG